tara:strand:+ start:201 stop:545 length:345 start_codon:yes stop_codon:yes gene_type:complete
MSTWTYNQSQRKVEAFDLDSIKQALQNGDTVYRIHKAPYKGGNRQSFANPYVLQDDNLFVNLMPFPTQTWEIDMASIVTQAREIYREQQALTTLEKDYYASVATQEAASPEATA